MKKIVIIGFLFLVLCMSIASARYTDGIRYTFDDRFSSIDPDILDEGPDFYRKQFVRQDQPSQGVSMERNEALRELHYEYLLIRGSSGKEYTEINNRIVPVRSSSGFALQRNQRLVVLHNEIKYWEEY